MYLSKPCPYNNYISVCMYVCVLSVHVCMCVSIIMCVSLCVFDHICQKDLTNLASMFISAPLDGYNNISCVY